MDFCATFLKISAKCTREAMAKFLEIHASFLSRCIIASCWLSMKTNLRRRLWRNFSGHLSVGFCAILLKILAKGTPEVMAKLLEIHALFLVLCIIASCWVSIKTNLRRRLWRNFFRTSLCGFLCNSLEDLS